jgi:hypothetical protein
MSQVYLCNDILVSIAISLCKCNFDISLLKTNQTNVRKSINYLLLGGGELLLGDRIIDITNQERNNPK